MRRILEGVARFQKKIFPEHRELFQELANQQSPETLLITCSDSRVVPDLLVQSNPGEVFICRNAGNIAPSFGEPGGGVSATIEYAVVALNVRDIIVCGHSDCGAMKAVLKPSLVEGMPGVARWLRYADRAAAVVQHNCEHTCEHTNEAELLACLTEENVLAQLDNLRTHPCVASRLKAGTLALHGWVYDIRSGKVRVYDPVVKGFVPLNSEPVLVRKEEEVWLAS